jgi:hypothetical protein
MKSIVEKRGRVEFPEHTGERIYMLPVRGRLPTQYRRWQDTVDQMLDGISPPVGVYLMVDQGEVSAGQSQRRPGLHVDGNWIAELGRHGHRHASRWDHPRPGFKHHAYTPEAIILATDVIGCRSYVGDFQADIGRGGECDDADTSGMHHFDLEPFRAWAGNVTMLHEALPMPHATKRTVVRLNVPGWEPL